MATTRPFAYNTGSAIAGTQQSGSVAIGTEGAYNYAANYGGVQWWEGPVEDNVYIIVSGSSPYPNFNFYGCAQNDAAFITLTNILFRQNFTTGQQCYNYLTGSNYWTNYIPFTITGLILNWNIQDASSYGGTGTTITDLQGNSNGTIVGTIDYTNSTPDYLTVQGAVGEYITSATNLNSKLSPANTGTDISVFVWAYPTSNGTIVSEQGSSTPDSGWYDSQIELVSGTMKFRVWDSSGFSSTIATPLNNWYYVGFTYLSATNTLTAYVNGQSAGTTTVARQSPGNNGAGLYYNLGYPTATNMGSGAGSTFRFGALSVYNRGLTSAEVLTNYNATKGTYGL